MLLQKHELDQKFLKLDNLNNCIYLHCFFQVAISRYLIKLVFSLKCQKDLSFLSELPVEKPRGGILISGYKTVGHKKKQPPSERTTFS